MSANQSTTAESQKDCRLVSWSTNYVNNWSYDSQNNWTSEDPIQVHQSSMKARIESGLFQVPKKVSDCIRKTASAAIKLLLCTSWQASCSSAKVRPQKKTVWAGLEKACGSANAYGDHIKNIRAMLAIIIGIIVVLFWCDGNPCKVKVMILVIVNYVLRLYSLCLDYRHIWSHLIISES